MQLALHRFQFLGSQGFRDHTKNVFAIPEVHSDDELVPNASRAVPHGSAGAYDHGDDYEVCEKEGRNDKFTDFLRIVEEDRHRYLKRKPGTLLYVLPWSQHQILTISIG